MMKMNAAYLYLVAWLTYAAPAWVTMVAGVFVLTSLTLSLFLLFEHLAAYKNPEVCSYHLEGRNREFTCVRFCDFSFL